jgi:biopolymer transport protein TolR
MPNLARRSRGYAQPAITLLINVMLVLTIMVLFSARLSQEGTQPSVSTSGQRPQPGDSSGNEIILEYSADRRITLNKKEVPRSELGVQLRDIYRARADKTMWLLGAGTLRYGEVADVINTAKVAGVERVGVITPEMRRRWRSAPAVTR